MEKTVRVCDECGEEIGPQNPWVECAACGKWVCLPCSGQLDDYLCPTHYKQVKEFIEGLKEPPTIHAYDNLCGQVVGTKWVDGKITELTVDGVKFVPEGLTRDYTTPWIVTPTFSFSTHQWEVERDGGYVLKGRAITLGDSDKSIRLTKAAAEALYEHIRREHGDS